MSDLLHALTKSISEEFMVDDLVPCLHGKEVFRIVEINDNFVEFELFGEKDKVRLDYPSVAAAMMCCNGVEGGHEMLLLQSFVAEYRVRLEQTRHEAEVDAMWRSAIVCQL